MGRPKQAGGGEPNATPPIPVDPTSFQVRRDERYDGGGFDVTLDTFAPEDAEVLGSVHDRCQEIYEAWLQVRGEDDWGTLHRAAHRIEDPGLRARIDRLGEATQGIDPPQEVWSVLHDVRGGALAALVIEVELMDGSDDEGALQTAAFLARDHAKMMRNALRDVAPALRTADEEERPHPVRDLLTKWDDRRYEGARIQVEIRTDQVVAARCLEASAVDRVLYNLVNNAVRHTADDAVRLLVREGTEEILQIVVSNVVDSDQRAWLEERGDGPRLSFLFQRGVTRGGQGLGLDNAVGFVAAAFGVEGSGRAVDEGYVGATLDGEEIHVWFHWPAVPGEA